MREPEDATRLAHRLWEVSALSLGFIESKMSDSGLTPASHGVLDLISSNPGTSIVEMTQSIPTSVQAISQIVGRLERRGLITRRAGPRGRSVALYVTREGDRAREDAEALLEEGATVLRSALGVAEHDQLVHLLDHARGRFQHLTGPAASSPP